MTKKKPISLQFLKKSILKILQKHKSILNSRQISWALNLKGSEYQKKISHAIMALKNDNLIVEKDKYRYVYNFQEHVVFGNIEINKSGHGYVKSELYKNDIFIHKNDRLNSLQLDTVAVKIIKNKNEAVHGRVQEVVERSNLKFIGVIEKNEKNYFFIPDNIKTGSDFFIPKKNLNGARNNSRVIIEFTDWPISAGCPFGKVNKILPENFTLKSEIDANIEIFNIRNNFGSKIKNELIKINPKIKPSDQNGRKDFRNHITFTIDPDDAKDFDDALSIKLLKNGNIEVGVHIADVSHYVTPNSAIDNEAFLRAFSVYFPGKVVPMLPEELSNTICSLNPNEDKLCFSVIVIFKKNLSQIDSVWMGKTIINSNCRFTYEEAEVLIGKKSKKTFANEIITLNTIAKNLRSDRIKKGSIDFERTNLSFELNNDREPIKVLHKKPLQAHKLIEEFMLLANKLVAKKLHQLKEFIYRIHDRPNKDKIEELFIYLNQFNLKIKPSSLSLSINRLLNNNNINKGVVENLILRAMAKANYSTKNIGHYGLCFNEYTHFTSPIRRYADLMVHRILNTLLNKQNISYPDLEKKCIHFSNIERTYVELERKTNKFIQLKLLENCVGNTFEGIITGIVKWGIYVDIGEGQGEGLISNKSLLNDKYYYNDDLKSFIGRRSGKKYLLGDSVIVKIKSIDLSKREMDLLIE